MKKARFRSTQPDIKSVPMFAFQETWIVGRSLSQRGSRAMRWSGSGRPADVNDKMYVEFSAQDPTGVKCSINFSEEEE